MRKGTFLRFLLKGCFKGSEKRSVSLMFLSSEATNMCILYVSKHFTLKGKVQEKCCQVGLCCFKLNRMIYCFSCRIMWYQIFLLVSVCELE